MEVDECLEIVYIAKTLNHRDRGLGNGQTEMAKRKSVVANVLKVGALSALTITAFAVAAPPAFGAGTSGKVNNCYTQWWNTAWAQKCDSPGASVSGNYTSIVDCSAPEIPDRSMNVNRSLNSTDTVSGYSNCAWGINTGYIQR